MIIKQKSISSITELPKIKDYQKIQLENHQTTVSKGTLAESVKYTADKNLSLEALIRPTTEYYQFNDLEIKIMEADIFEAQAIGADSVSIGALTSDNTLDIDTMEQLIGAAGGMQVTLNHAFDQMDLEAQKQAIDFANEHGIDYIMIQADFNSEKFLIKLQKLIGHNQGSVQFVLTGKDQNKLIAMCNEFNLHQILVEE